MADHSRRSDTTDDGAPAETAGSDDGTRAEATEPIDRPGDAAGDSPLPPDVAEDLRTVADRIDDYAETLPFGPARHHARIAARAAREAADGDAPLVARRAAVGELVTELRIAADEAEATRAQYRLLELLYEEALPTTRAAGTALY